MYPLKIETYDGSCQPVHPNVIRNDPPFHGYQYLMAMTPYPDSDDTFENPSIRGSNDGMIWEPLIDIPDPIIPRPIEAGYHHSDPCIVIKDDTLYLFFRTTDKKSQYSTISLTQTSDFKKWSTPKKIYSGKWVLSPAIIFEKGVWKMWFVDMLNASQSQLMLITGKNVANMKDETQCNLSLDSYTPWHIEIKKNNLIYQALITGFPGESISNRQALFFAESDDGENWSALSKPILKPSIFGWDNKLIYKASFIPQEGNKLSIWYSACSLGGKWHVGYLEGAITNLQRITGKPPLIINWPKKYMEDLYGLIRENTKKFMPNYIIEFLRNLR